MSKQDKEHIKDFLSNVNVDKAPVDFTDKVMQNIYALTGEETLKDANLSALLQKNIIEKPSENLLAEVMSKVDLSTTLQFKPLIGKKAWFVIILTLVALISFSIMNGTSTESSSILNEISPYLDQLKGFFNFSSKGFVLSPVLMISITSLFSLLIVDNFLKREVTV